jgi:hypothetical protein
MIPSCHSSHGSKYLDIMARTLVFLLDDCLIGNLLSKYLPPMFVLPTHPLNEGYDKGTHRSSGILLAKFCEVGGQVIVHKRTYLAKFGYWLEKKQICF